MAHQTKYLEYKSKRIDGTTPNALASELGVSNGACYKYERKLERELGEHYSSIQTKGSVRARRRSGVPTDLLTKDRLREEVSKLRTEVDRLTYSVAVPVADMTPTSRGMLGEDLVYYQLRRRGYEVFRPMAFTSGTDLLVIGKSRPLRCEVKSTLQANLGIEIKRGKYDNGLVKCAYEKGAVDVFALVDLLHEHVFIYPAHLVDGMPRFTLTHGCPIWEYKDRYDFFDLL